MNVISKDMAIGEVVARYPKTMEVFLGHGLMCFGCAMAQYESIEQGAKAHGTDIEALITNLNEAVSQTNE